MTTMDIEPKISQMRLLPHQTALLNTFFNPTSERVVVLRGDVGLGKSVALVALAGRLLRERPTARALFLVPGALRSQFVEMLRRENTPTLSVDRYLFREMLDSTTGGDFWPTGIVAVVGREFARQEDILNALAKTRWDLLIVDEAHQFMGTFATNVLRRVVESSERIVLATRPNLKLPDGMTEGTTTFLHWRHDQVVGYDGRLLDTMPRPLLHEIPFSLSDTELNSRELVNELARILEANSSQQGLIARSLRRCLGSSPAALESALQRLLRGLATDYLEPLLESTEEGVAASEEDVLEAQSDSKMDRLDAEKAGIAMRALQQIDAIGGDSKLAAFVGLVGQLNGVTAPARRICVLTDYRATLYYLAAGIEGPPWGLACRLLHGDMNADDRHRSLALFSSAGGILVATTAVTEGVNLRDVTDLVLYDLPNSEPVLWRVLGQFDRFLRVTQLNVHVFVPTNSGDVLISEAVQLLRNILGSAGR